jgi:D-sedoheptulose 7-phosphate isomerase
VVGFTKAGDTPLAQLSDVVIAVPHNGYSDRIQEMHITAVHIIIEALEKLVSE